MKERKTLKHIVNKIEPGSLLQLTMAEYAINGLTNYFLENKNLAFTKSIEEKF